MTTTHSHFNSFFSLFVLVFLHLGCFIFSSSYSSCNNSDKQPPSPPKRRKVSPSSPILPPPSSTSNSHKFFSVVSSLSRLLSLRKPSSNRNREPEHHQSPGDLPTCPSSSLQLIIPLSPDVGVDGNVQVSAESVASVVAAVEAIYPCPACGEVLNKPHLLDLHQATKHSLSELCNADSGYNIVRIIFHSGWKGKSPPVVHRVFKIHNTTRTLARYEEYRDAVRSRAARYAARSGNGGGGYERCIADGNERLRFYCTTTLCSLSAAAPPAAAVGGGVCGSPYCCACAIVRHGFTGKHADMDGIATHATSWGAHASLPADLEREFAFLRARRAMLVCRVVAGRVAHQRGGGAAGEGEEEEEDEEEKGTGFDSVVPQGGGGGARDVGEDELLVFSPRAVLPCFVIIYTA